MKNLKFEKLSLISRKEKAARTVQFDPKTTVISGDNDTGKSSLIKSIYWVLGAEPATHHPDWVSASVSGLLHFSVDGEKYKILRHGRQYGVFDENDDLKLNATSVTKELAPFISDLLDFKLRLTSQQGESQIPPPAYCFLPFYADQDHSWQNAWSGFANLRQFKNWKTDTLAYHAGIRPNAYFELKAKLVALTTDLQELVTERNALERAMARFRRSRKTLPVSFMPGVYEAAVRELLGELEALQRDREKITADLSDLANTNARLSQQKAIALASLSELEKDFKFARTVYAEKIICPTCHTEHDNSFQNRFSLIEDQEECRGFLAEINEEIRRVDIRAKNLREKLNRSNFRRNKINRLLQEKKGNLRLNEVIEEEGKVRAVGVVKDQLDNIEADISTVDHQIAEINREIKRTFNKNRKEEIDEFFSVTMDAELKKLNVFTVNASEYSEVKAQIRDTGSDHPRALLAYYVSFIKLMKEFSSSPMCPLVLDSPIQQDQDRQNRKVIMNYLASELPNGVQLVLGTVSNHEAVFEGSQWIPGRKHHLLQKEEFEDVAERFRPYFDALV